ncbi:hypothetical protein [Alteribacter aurantiacus]|uniref:hypothetical protein n=1 Tax=Alteribacter aurantiacus TaxID=254410 RepID=UPI0004256F1F|nr:hypothetical protein [Alteribacter aurantiacus]
MEGTGLKGLFSGLRPTSTTIKSLPLMPGQLLQGKVKQLYPNNLATLTYGQTTVTAKLEVGLERDRTYWFEVASTEGMPKLKVLTGNGESKYAAALHGTTDSLLKEWKATRNSAQERLLTAFTSIGIPFTKEVIEQGERLFKHSSLPIKQTLEVLSDMASRRLPFTEETFLSLASLKQDGSLAKGLEQLYTSLIGKEHRALMLAIQSFLPDLSRESGIQRSFPPPLHTFMNGLGLIYEANMAHSVDTNHGISLKAQLLSFLQNPEISSEQRKLAQAIVFRITGIQLQNIDQHHTHAHNILSIPVKFGNITQDMTVQWEGLKKQNGDWDSNHCRILFYIELASLNETVIDVHIQNRVVTVHLYNENKKPEIAISTLRPLLEESLKKGNYVLSSILWTRPTERNEDQKLKTTWSPKKGIDIRI